MGKFMQQLRASCFRLQRQGGANLEAHSYGRKQAAEAQVPAHPRGIRPTVHRSILAGRTARFRTASMGSAPA